MKVGIAKALSFHAAHGHDLVPFSEIADYSKFTSRTAMKSMVQDGLVATGVVPKRFGQVFHKGYYLTESGYAWLAENSVYLNQLIKQLTFR